MTSGFELIFEPFKYFEGRGDKTDSNLNGIYLKTLLLKVKKFCFEIESIEIGEKFFVLKILYS